MNRFQFWATLATASILGFLGLIFGEALPRVLPFTPGQARAFYALIGILLALLTFARVSSWVAKAAARMAASFASRLAAEVAKQVNKAASRFPGGRQEGKAGSGGNPGKLNPDYSGKLAGAVILDTSSIIDGRILEVAEAGFISGTVVVPDFVLKELQQVADSSDSIKRARGRRGFEIISQLKKVKGVKVEVLETAINGQAVDDALVDLGKRLKGRVLTCDFNLNRVAKIKGVSVLNLNELGNALKALPVPGESLETKIVHVGKDQDQGVGYLGDGTMVVVKDAASLVGQEITVEVTKLLQGPAGRMIFGKKLGTENLKT